MPDIKLCWYLRIYFFYIPIFSFLGLIRSCSARYFFRCVGGALLVKTSALRLGTAKLTGSLQVHRTTLAKLSKTGFKLVPRSKFQKPLCLLLVMRLRPRFLLEKRKNIKRTRKSPSICGNADGAYNWGLLAKSVQSAMHVFVGLSGRPRHPNVGYVARSTFLWCLLWLSSVRFGTSPLLLMGILFLTLCFVTYIL